MKRFNFQAFFKNMRHHSVSGMGEKDTAVASQPTHEMEVEYRAEEEALDGSQTTSQANLYTPSQSLREDYFLAVQCERLTCRHSVQEANYKFCPKCGYTTVPIYDYYQLFGLAVSREGLFDEELLKKNFRELSKYYHPDSQIPSLQSPQSPEQAYPSAAPKQFNDSEQVSESQGTVFHHENFSFLSAALEILKNPTTRAGYHQQYIETLQELFPEQMALAEEVPEAAHSAPPTTPPKPAFSFQALWKRCVLFSVTFLDLLVTALIGFLVIKAYLWGAILSLIGAWFYFRKTRQFLSRLYS